MDFSSRVVLTTRSEHLSAVNRIVGAIISGPFNKFTFTEKAYIEEPNGLRYSMDIPNMLTAGPVLPYHNVIFKFSYIL